MQCLRIALLTIFLLNWAICDRFEEVSTYLQLLEMDLEDYCDKWADTQKLVICNATNAREQKIDYEISYGSFVRSESELLQSEYNREDVDSSIDLVRTWNLLSKMGDPMLSEESWKKLVKFKNKNEDLHNNIKIECPSKVKDCTLSRKDIDHVLAASKNSMELQTIWSASQEIYLEDSKEYSNILELLKEAAKANDFEEPYEYWEMLVEYEDAYSEAKSLWLQIEPLYIEFHKFVKSRLQQYYDEMSASTSIPAYLLGTENGIDWSRIAPLVLPHRYLYDEIMSMLEFANIGGRKAYEIAGKLITSIDLKLGTAEDKFWKYSLFNETCPSKVLTYCSEKYPIVVTCNSTGWSEYLDAHEDMMHMALNNLNYTATTLNGLRISALDEAIVSLGSILALKNLPLMGIVPEDVFEEDTDENQMTALFLTALRVLPRLPYYLLADTWRLEQLKKNSTDLSHSWWKEREKIQRVKGFTNTEWDFLGDTYMVSNKPYIGKFLGSILQFQLLEHFQHEDHSVNILSRIAQDEEFRTLLKQRSRKEWPKVLYDNLYYDVSADSLLEYFKPLKEYMEKAPVKQETRTVIPKTTTPLPKTTTHSVISTTPVTTTVPQKHMHAPPKVIANKMDILSQAQPQDVVTMKLPKFIDINSKSKEFPQSPKEREESPVSSNTATWIGASVGIGTLIILIVIVGRRKFRKRPVTNNRRFEA